MNQKRIEKYIDMIKQFPQDEQSATDGLIKSCDSPNFPIIEVEARAFIYRSMQNAIKDQLRKEKKMTSNIPEKEFQVKKGKKVKRVKITKEQFIPKWLYDNGLDNSMRNLQLAEDAYDESGTPVRVQPVELSLNSKRSPDGDDARSLAEFIPSLDKNPEDLILSKEEVNLLIGMPGIEDKKLRQTIGRYLPKINSGADKEDVITGYLKGILSLVASTPNWRTQFTTDDLNRLCGLAGVKLDRVLQMSPSYARRSLEGKAGQA
jgi:hypothetical protein